MTHTIGQYTIRRAYPKRGEMCPSPSGRPFSCLWYWIIDDARDEMPMHLRGSWATPQDAIRPGIGRVR